MAGETEGTHVLPPGWAWTTLGEITLPPRLKLRPDPNSNLPFLGMDSIEPNALRPSRFGQFGEMKSAASAFQPGDVIYGRLRRYLNKVWCATFPGAASAEFIVFPSNPFIDSAFLQFVLHDRRFVQFASHLVSGDRPRVDIEQISQYQMAVPPLAEQRRISAKIEELFGEIEAGEQELEKAREGLAAYRRAVLKAAVTGDLTRDWRRDTKTANETGCDFLERILVARRDMWAKLTEESKTSKGITRRYLEPTPADPNGLHSLPEGWAWASMDQLLTVIEAGLNFRCEERPPRADEVGIVKVSAVTWGSFDETASKTIKENRDVDEDKRIHEGDFLFSRANTLELVGAPVIVESISRNLLLSDKVLRFRFAAPVERWVCYVLRSPWGRREIETRSTGNQLSMRNITQENIRKIRVPLPLPTELQEATKRLVVFMHECSTMAAALDGWARDTSRARQSVLVSAFAGKLVAQQPADVPATVLLGQFKAAKAASMPEKPFGGMSKLDGAVRRRCRKPTKPAEVNHS